MKSCRESNRYAWLCRASLQLGRRGLRARSGELSMLERIVFAPVELQACSVASPNIYRCRLFVDKAIAGTPKGLHTARPPCSARTNGSMPYTRRRPHHH